RTRRGAVPVERLRTGDLVATRDHGFQPLRLLAIRRVPATGSLAPVVFAPGAIGNQRELVLSPQHRLLVRGAAAELFFGEPEVLVPAIALVNGADILRREGGTIDYHHLVFDQHEIVYAEGVEAESLLVGGGGLERMPAALRREVLAIFPEAASWDEVAQPVARPCITRREGALLAAVLAAGG
ncbi:MAG: Hint domain-containing protein, partial [Rhodobacteraceae bacterium]|nr:Hint domain-containing protein [Paracoccaceae bacterium]